MGAVLPFAQADVDRNAEIERALEDAYLAGTEISGRSFGAKLVVTNGPAALGAIREAVRSLDVAVERLARAASLIMERDGLSAELTANDDANGSGPHV